MVYVTIFIFYLIITISTLIILGVNNVIEIFLDDINAITDKKFHYLSIEENYYMCIAILWPFLFVLPVIIKLREIIILVLSKGNRNGMIVSEIISKTDSRNNNFKSFL